MNHKFWVYRDGGLIVQKYQGSFEHDQLLEISQRVLQSIPDNLTKVQFLSDISEGRFPKLSSEQFEVLLDMFNKNVSMSFEMQIAIYTGMNTYDDFITAHKFANYFKGGQYNAIPFNILDSALNWLGLSKEEMEKINKDLSDFY